MINQEPRKWKSCVGLPKIGFHDDFLLAAVVVSERTSMCSNLGENSMSGSADVTPEMSSIHGVFQKSALRQRSQLINVFSGWNMSKPPFPDGSFPKIDVPQNGLFMSWKILWKIPSINGTIWGYPLWLRKPPDLRMSWNELPHCFKNTVASTARPKKEKPPRRGGIWTVVPSAILYILMWSYVCIYIYKQLYVHGYCSNLL